MMLNFFSLLLLVFKLLVVVVLLVPPVIDAISGRSVVVNGLQVIGAGLGRTGTNSLRVALNELGYGPTHHMIEIIGVPGAMGNAYARNHVDRWPLVVKHILEKATTENGTIDHSKVHFDDWDDVFEGYHSAVDQPASLFAVELAHQYPNAKVILTLRSSAKKWHNSTTTAWCRFIEGGMTNWIDQAFYDFRGSDYFALFSSFERRFREFHHSMDEYVARVLGGDFADTFSTAHICRDEKYATQYYNAWKQHIIDNIAPERLLILETGDKDTAKKLREFLGVPPSKMEHFVYPKTNSDKEFQHGPIFFKRLEAVLSIVGPVLILLAIQYFVIPRNGGRPKEAAASEKKSN